MDLTNYNTMSEAEIKKLKQEFIHEILAYASDNEYVLEKMLRYYTKSPSFNGLRLANKKVNYEQLQLLYTKENILKKYKDFTNLIKLLKRHHVDLNLLEKIIKFEGADFASLANILDNKSLTLKDLRSNYNSEYPISLFDIDFGFKKELIDYRADYRKREKAFMKFVDNDKKKYAILMEKLNNYAGTCLTKILDKLTYDQLVFLINHYTENDLIYISYILQEKRISYEDIANNALLISRMYIMYANNSEDFNSKYALKLKNYIQKESLFENSLRSTCSTKEIFEFLAKKLSYDGGQKVLKDGLKLGFTADDIYNLLIGKVTLSFDSILIMYTFINLGFYSVEDIQENFKLNPPLKIPIQRNWQTCNNYDKELLFARIELFKSKLKQALGVKKGDK